MAKQSLEVGGDPRLACSAVFSVTSVLFLSLFLSLIYTFQPDCLCSGSGARGARIAFSHRSNTQLNSTQLDSTHAIQRIYAISFTYTVVSSSFSSSSPLFYGIIPPSSLDCAIRTAHKQHTQANDRAPIVLYCFAQEISPIRLLTNMKRRFAPSFSSSSLFLFLLLSSLWVIGSLILEITL